ncbi:type II toxin-antitoxin system HicA family toxin [Gluconobacter cadivus]|uniref:Type II toxin-antitoxin system HicA family toxin n=1 Tax=Gluconobacter cadivus TaxID=2728101 RepID=A0ABR9YU76_9PROT|nr:type II toxin-antitoxin system HicA family toxin [Gluconobacter cadivus]MBF0888090.1 type II toxin-antitoxin system HicA family toxin [Gluconobacter cadivus]
MNGLHSEMRQLRKQAAALGWSASRTNGGHLRWRHETGSLVFSPSTPGDVRSIRNTLATIKRETPRADTK